jgi:hypothetical protein
MLSQLRAESGKRWSSVSADGLIAGASVAAAAGVTLFAVARVRARSIEASPEEERAHELRVCLRRMAPVA